MKLLQQGAEAKIYLSDNSITKSRIPKSYRHPVLDDKIRKSRTRREAKLLTKALALGINVPRVIKTDKSEIEIEFIDGDRLSEKLNAYSEAKQFETMQKLGKQAALLHSLNIIHGDLTTSNVILENKDVFLIDFGLAEYSIEVENVEVI